MFDTLRPKIALSDPSPLKDQGARCMTNTTKFTSLTKSYFKLHIILCHGDNKYIFECNINDPKYSMYVHLRASMLYI